MRKISHIEALLLSLVTAVTFQILFSTSQILFLSQQVTSWQTARMAATHSVPSVLVFMMA
jgi:hypothetical protein